MEAQTGEAQGSGVGTAAKLASGLFIVAFYEDGNL
jgi:hypothetical protein